MERWCSSCGELRNVMFSRFAYERCWYCGRPWPKDYDQGEDPLLEVPMTIEWLVEYEAMHRRAREARDWGAFRQNLYESSGRSGDRCLNELF
jgi:hypothetical protein